jgi:hypothetical protein
MMMVMMTAARLEIAGECLLLCWCQHGIHLALDVCLRGAVLFRGGEN